MRKQIGVAEKHLTLNAPKSDQIAHAAAGYYRLAIIGVPFCEGAAIVDTTGTAIVVMHTTDQLISGAGLISPEGRFVLDQGSECLLRLEFIPENATVTGQFETGETALPVSGLRRGTESRAGLINLSSRGRVGTGSGILIAGLVVKGPGPADLLVRGIGPALAQFNVPDPLVDPKLEVIQNDVLLATNHHWIDFHEADAMRLAHERAGAFALDPQAKDAALLIGAQPGSFMVHISGNDAGTGTALAEVYHLREPIGGTTSDPRLLNLSVRGLVGAKGEPLVVGFVIYGDRPRQVFVRAIGPSLVLYNLPDYLPDPELTLYRGSEILATAPYANTHLPDNYHTNLMSIATTVGAFPPMDQEPTLAVWLEPGVYTAVVQPEESDGGLALVEIYEIPFDAPAN
ncbi:MAG: hypothetical protein DRP71_04065 [Verrucomicrobia bacterium]|nr:MAG: hypothetical protein DRP71_04065 [Verrucomicrobiota bacterium]